MSLNVSRYLYTGIVDYDQHHKEVILQFLVAADELGLSNLIQHIQDYLIDDEEYLHKDPVVPLEVIYQHETFENLKDYCLEIISAEPKILFTSQKFTSLEKPIITMVLQRDDLKMKEIEIWESFLRWLFVHNLKSDDESTWSSETSTDIKQIVQEYTPLIRFYDISKEDFFLKVYPYRNFLPQDLES
ncbi:8183_t:CDS:2 [Funneliformis geosporum]|uniref:8183_t:CDS:1 n=1 Tax=Funneliformis geosporum TaxID=1117311 RepID=A0A9W4WN24_9GLOM|nr:8183_t:CDS:2 [Funneliformis geosporum]